MRILKWTYAALSLLLLQSCLDDSYKGSASDSLGQGELVPVRVSVGDPSGGIVHKKSSSLKGTGPIDNMSQVDGKDIYVYAFSKDMLTSYAKKSEEDIVNTLVDGSIDNPGSRAGKRAKSRAGSMYLDWAESKTELYYHSGDMSQLPYDFFAYYIDDMKVSETDYKRSEHTIALNVEIDGSHDLMSAKAEIDEQQVQQCPLDERAYVKEYSYSYFTGIRNILPKFYFKHHLTRLEFELVPGETYERKLVAVQSIQILSKYKGLFTIADKGQPSQLGVTFNDDRKALTLKEKNGAEILPNTYTLNTITSSSQTVKSVQIGGSLLVAPQDLAFEAIVTINETRPNGTTTGNVVNRIEVKYTPAPGEMMYAAGNQYKIKFKIFGATNVSANVTLEDWADGGKLDIDTESDKPDIN